jgi:glycosyltransferase involved in cell wall biosynthesis
MSAAPRPAVILCTHNPRADYLARTLAALAAQTLPASAYDLLVVDNASREPVAGRFDLAWHPSARMVVEPSLGLTHARLRGIAEADNDLLVWVDDDNLLAPDYLAQAQSLARDWPMLGAWGCGHFTPEWETPPSPDFAPYLDYLAVGRTPADRWGNRAFDYSAMPAGAGLCCRRPVARRYAATVAADPRRALLGRTGAGLGACEDFDLCLHAIDLGLGTGVFPRLRLTHLMPAGRVREDYLLRLVEGHARSTVLLMALRDPAFRPAGQDWKSRLRAWRLRRSLGPVARRIHDARLRGEKTALAALSSAPVPSP